jgi:hypothetical protein
LQNPLQTLTSFFTVTFASSARGFIIAQDKPAVAALNHLRWVPDEECNPMPIARLLGHGRPCRTRPGKETGSVPIGTFQRRSPRYGRSNCTRAQPHAG